MIDAGEAARKLVLNLARFSGVAQLARRWTDGIGAVLMLHRVTAAPQKRDSVNGHLLIHPGFLDALIADMKKTGFQFVSIDEALERIAAGRTGTRFATVTLDDGYRDNLVEALPVFEKHGTPFTVYVAPGLVNGSVDLWWELIERIVDARDRLYLNTPEGRVALDCSTPARRLAANKRLHDHLSHDVREEDQVAIVRDLARSANIDFEAMRHDLLMNWDEIRMLAAHPLATIGAHTIHHYSLKRLTEDKAMREMADAARMIAIELGRSPSHMAYPYGFRAAVGEREVALARAAGFRSAVTTRHGMIQPEHRDHPTALPRISVNGRYQGLGYMRTMLTGISTPLANSGKTVVTV